MYNAREFLCYPLRLFVLAKGGTVGGRGERDPHTRTHCAARGVGGMDA